MKVAFRVVRDWAKKESGINRIYFFGSRIWGQQQPNSDLDMLIVADPGAINDEWTEDLSRRIGLTCHLTDYYTLENETLLDRIKTKGLLVFSRSGTDEDFIFEDEIEAIDPSAAL